MAVKAKRKKIIIAALSALGCVLSLFDAMAANSVAATPDDIGKVIGKNGKRAQAIRSIMKAKYAKSGKRVVVDIIG